MPKMRVNKGWVVAAITALTAVGVGGTLYFRDRPLTKIHAGIAAKYQNVTHLDAADFQKLDPRKTAIFDVREMDEHAVSHLPGAIRVDPDMDADAFLRKYGKMISGKKIVFYCSVGARSSAFASRVNRVDPSLAGQNLTGGLFNWHNERRSLVRIGGKETDFIHPYSRVWGKLINRQDKVSFRPVTAAN